MAEGDEKLTAENSAGSSESKDKIVKVSPEDYTISTKDCTSLKVICLGDSAVGKSKLVNTSYREHHNKLWLVFAD